MAECNLPCPRSGNGVNPWRNAEASAGGARRGLVARRQLVCLLPSTDWQWRKTNGLKDPDIFAFDANFLAQQLQNLIPRDRG